MRAIEIESWALRVIDSVKDLRQTEDTKVELKAEWPAPKNAARRIAGQANSALGDPILWLIGVDEKRGAIVGADMNDFSDWWQQVCVEFDELAPVLTELAMPVDGKTIVALQFDTDRAPFVVKNPDGGRVQREVPWRDGTSVRTARRSDLVRMLLPMQHLPAVEVVACFLCYRVAKAAEHFDVTVQLRASLYVIPAQGERAVIPWRKCVSWCAEPLTQRHLEFLELKLLQTHDVPPGTPPPGMQGIFYEPVGLEVFATECWTTQEEPSIPRGQTTEFGIELWIQDAGRAVGVRGEAGVRLLGSSQQ